MSVKTKSTNQKAAEAEVEEFQEDLGPFVVAAETTRIAMVFTNAKAPHNPIIFANDSFLDLTGYRREEVLAQNFNFMVENSDKPEVLAQVQEAFEDNTYSGPEICCRRKDGSLFLATIFVNPVKDKSGDVIQHFASFIDTTHRKKEVEHLHFLLDELNHRTQNALATVLAIAGQTLRGGADKEAVDTFEGRIMALSKVHSMLGRKDWDDLSLRDVIDQVVKPFDLKEDTGTGRFSVKGVDVHLQPQASLTLAMALHELATNAGKYGSLSNHASGKVDITWKIEATLKGEQVSLRWQESGGPTVKPPNHRGLGLRLIEGGLARDMNGEVNLDFAPAGLVCQIIIPIDRDMISEMKP